VWLEQAASLAQQEYENVWMGTEHPHWRQVFEGLSRHYDVDVLNDLAEAESGWDMTTRFDRRTLNFIPIDLNSLLYKYEVDLSEFAAELGRPADAEVWQERSEQRQKVVDNYLWDSQKGAYFDFDYSRLELGGVWSLATYSPMWSGMASKRQAAELVKNLQRFDCPGGLSTTAKEPHIEMDVPTQWAYPNGWAPLQLMVIEGLERYGYKAEARRYARKWLATNLNWFAHREEFLEKYNVVEPELPPVQGLYPNQVGFGWTNAVFVCLANKYLDSDET
jgi:alpha,alpha-trehalase